MHAVTGPYATEILERPAGRARRHRDQRRAAGGLRRRPSRPQPDLRRTSWSTLMLAGRRARLRRRLRRRRRPQHDPRPALLRHPQRQPGGAGGQCHLAPGYRGGLARRRALDAHQRGGRPRGRGAGHPLLRNADRLEVLRQPARRRPLTLCGEESFGTGSNHVREKDGLWAVLFWLNILAVREQPVGEHRARALAALRPQLLLAPRLRGGRRRGRRRADDDLRAAAAGAAGHSAGRLHRRAGRRLRLHRPVDGSVTKDQGIRIGFDDGSRIVFRLSGTGTEGADAAGLPRALRARSGPPRPGHPGGAGRADRIARDLAQIETRTGRAEPTVIT